MFLLQNALKNIWRQRRRYRVLLPLILVCALLTGVFMTVAVPCRQYSDRIITVAYDFTAEEAAAVEEMSSHARELGEGASLIQFGVLLVGAIAILYVSSLMIGERMREVGIFYTIGLSRGQIFVTMFVELFTVCTAALLCGLTFGRILAVSYLQNEITASRLPEEILSYMGNGTAESLCIIAAVGILLLPILRLAVKLLRTDPNGFLTFRK